MALTLAEIQQKTLALLEARIDQVALLRSVIDQVSAVDVESPEACDKIAALAQCDPPLAMRIMRLANDDPNQLGQVTNIRDGILKVGAKRLAEMIFTLSVLEVFVAHTQSQRNLWVHSIQTALGSRRLAALHPELAIGPDDAYLAGLLHDIGRFLIFEHHPQDMAQIDEAEVEDPRDLIAAEIRVCGFDHATLGHLVCKRLNLPSAVCEMVRTHHFYGNKRDEIPPQVEGLVHLVQQSDFISFGLLQNRTRPPQFESVRDQWVARSVRHFASFRTPLSPQACVDEIRSIDKDARLAAALIDIAYPHPSANHQ